MAERYIVAVSSGAQRRWLCSLIGRIHGQAFVTGCSGGRELIAAAVANRDAHIVFGLNFDDIDGIDIVQILLGIVDLNRLTVLLDRTDAFTLMNLEEYGLKRVLDEGRGDDVIVDIMRGIPAECSRAGERLQREPRLRQQARMIRHLTPDLFRLVHLFSAGARDKDIARLTERSLHTIRTQRKRVYASLGVKSIAGLCLTMAAAGLIRFTNGRVIRPGVRGALAESVRLMDAECR